MWFLLFSVRIFCWNGESHRLPLRRFEECLNDLQICLKAASESGLSAGKEGYLRTEMDLERAGLIRSDVPTSLVFHRCLSFGSDVHFGRHSSSFLGRYIFKCPCSSATRARQSRILDTGLITYWLTRLLSLSVYQSLCCKTLTVK